MTIRHRLSSYLPKRNGPRKPFNFRKPTKEEINNAIRIALVSLAGIAFAITLTFIGIVAWFSKQLPDPNNLAERQIAETTKIYDRTGKVLLYEIHGAEKRTSIELADISPYAIHATVAVEDRNFYNHHGLSFRGIARAIYTDITTGGKAQGGSTITQQFIKNAVLSNEKTYTRKIKEIVLALELERRFSKDDILKFYLNEIPYGSVAYGIETASQTFFGKPAKDLTLSESTILAALPQAPTRYSPYGNNKEALLDRSHIIIDLMLEQGYINQEEADTAKADDVLKKIVPNQSNLNAPHFIFTIKEQLEDMYGLQTVEKEGLKVITTLDANLQNIAEQAIKDQTKHFNSFGANTAALMATDPRNGDILAYVGSADYYNNEIDGQANALTGLLQPGSSIKPIIYSAAFEKGYTPDTVLYDVTTTFKDGAGRDYIPKNYNLKQNGPVAMKQALAGSLNIPAVQTIYLTGVDNAVAFAERLGYTTFKDRNSFGLAFALGGKEVHPIEHIAAFGAFAQDGNLAKTKSILTVTDRFGKELFHATDEKTSVLSPQVARQISNIMSDNSLRAFVFGVRNSLTLGDRPVAAKTGTTNDFKDAWTIGFTPSLVTGVWVGNAKGGLMKNGADGSVVAAPIWNQFMRNAVKGTKVEYFPAPAPVVTGKPALDGGLDLREKVIIDRVSGKLATEFTPPEFREERSFGVPHSILYYVDKDNPQGPPPTNPAADPQFASWEASVAAWAISQGMTFGQAPTEYDDVHHPDTAPKISIFSPTTNTNINDRYFEAIVSVNASRTVTSVTYLIDDLEVATSTTYPYTGFISIPNSITAGFHNLTVRATDDVGNFGTTTIPININATPSTIGVTWSLPVPGSRIGIGSFPITVRFTVDNPTAVSKITLTAISEGGTSEVLGSVSDPSLSTFTFSWARPSFTGKYTLRVDSEGKNGESGRDSIFVNVE